MDKKNVVCVFLCVGFFCVFFFGINRGELSINESHRWYYQLTEAFYKDIKKGILGLFCPCYLMHENRKKLGYYMGQSLINNIFWMCAIFIPPIIFIVLEICQLTDRGLAYLGWVFYCLFVLIGQYHRMLIRESYQINGNPCCDCIAWCFCWYIAVTQENLQLNCVELKTKGGGKNDSNEGYNDGGDQTNDNKKAM